MIFVAGNVLRVQPPLVITRDEIDRGLEILESTLREYVAGELPEDLIHAPIGW